MIDWEISNILSMHLSIHLFSKPLVLLRSGKLKSSQHQCF